MKYVMENEKLFMDINGNIKINQFINIYNKII